MSNISFYILSIFLGVGLIIYGRQKNKKANRSVHTSIGYFSACYFIYSWIC